MLECSAAWCAGALAEASRTRDGQGLPTLPLPYLVLMKLNAGRTQDVADISRTLGQASAADLERVRSVIAQYASADLEDVESLIELGRLEIEGAADT